MIWLTMRTLWRTFAGSGAFRPVMYVLAAVVALGAAWGGITLHGNAKYREGVRDTTAKFIQSDLEGAGNVQDTAARVLRETHGLDGDADIDSLLDSTGGLRPDPES